jgi:hypothetical protein
MPFVNKAIDQVEFANLLLANDASEELQQSRFHIASLLAAQNNEIALSILNTMGG